MVRSFNWQLIGSRMKTILKEYNITAYYSMSNYGIMVGIMQKLHYEYCLFVKIVVF